MSDLVFTVYTEILTRFNSSPWFSYLLLAHETLFCYSKDFFYYVYSTNYTFLFTLKVVCALLFLSAIRGGVPRYRYDFLTKMGWIKFLGLVLGTFFVTLTLFWVW